MGVPALPLILGSAGGSILSSAIGAGVSSSNVDKTNSQNLQIARETNLLNATLAREQRDFSAQQQQMQNTFNRQMMSDYNEYNSPNQQVDRLLHAGLNPNMALTNPGVQGTPVVQGSLPSYNNPQMIAPQMQNASSSIAHLFGSISDAIGQTPKNITDAMQTKSNIEKQREETSNLKTLNDFQSSLLEAGLHLTKAQTAEIYQNCKQIEQNMFESQKRVEEMNQKISLMSEEQKGLVIDNIYKSDLYNNQINLLASQFNYNQAQTDYLRKTLPLTLLNINADVELKNATKNLTEAQINEVNTLTRLYQTQAEGQDWQNALNVMYGSQERAQGLEIGSLTKKDLEWQTSTLNRTIQSGTQIIGAVSNVVGTVYQVKGAKALVDMATKTKHSTRTEQTVGVYGEGKKITERSFYK